MHITCPSCRRVIPADDINVKSAIAKCTACHEIFSFAHLLPAAPSAPTPHVLTTVTPAAGGILGGIVERVRGYFQPMPKSEVEMPRGFAMHRAAGTLVITRRWISCAVIPLLVFSLFWNGIIFTIYAVMIPDIVGGSAPWHTALFPMLHLATGICIGYSALAGLLNTTEFRLSNYTLTVRHYPLWWPGGRAIGTEGIDQLFCKEKRGRKESRSYAVGVQLKSGERLTLVSNFEQPNQARFVEQEIERFLGIQDRLVPGEMYAP